MGVHKERSKSTCTTPETVAVLECISAAGVDISSIPQQERVIQLPLDTMVEIGKAKQVGFFDNLLRAEPKWLGFLSRAHCRLRLSCQQPAVSPQSSASGAAWSLSLSIENISANVILVGDQKLCKDRTHSIPEGGTLAFVAAPEPPQEVKFLVFALRCMHR